ncbi:hypothetical protein [Aquimarina sp. AU474]|uniref:hypothetical protein n=1 Tax=Aquimarina sp. AU474 TaxID=2108529 RepID=UPI000D689C21|nr:hypothetical protein [Aquimarina sp. AU474]
MDNFEKHIRENAAEFDEHKADRAKLWAHISTELQKEESKETKVIPLWVWSTLRIACFVVLLLSIGGFIGFSIYKSGTPKEQFVSKELQEINMHYKDLLAYQVELVQKNPNLSKEDKTEFLSFMDELDTEYETLRLEMHKNLDNEQVLEAIVANYQKRIDLITNLLQKINDSKKLDDTYGYTL